MNLFFDLIATLKAPAFFVLLLILLSVAGWIDSGDAELVADAGMKIENPLHVATRQEALCQ
jgi:hypothetical protein